MAITISIEEAIRRLSRYDNEYYTPKCRLAHRMGMEAIANQQSQLERIEELKAELREKTQWIPVTDRLPEDDLPKNSKSKQIKVLVAYMRNGNWVVRTNLRKKGQWYAKPDEWDWSVSDPISHWMPLPDAPREEGNK